MYTYQMVGLADENGRKYKCKYGTYTKNEGFVFNDKTLDYDVEELVGILLHDDLWKLDEPERKKMSIADIEKELGYRVQIIDPEFNKKESEKKEISSKHKKEVDEAIQFWKDFFGPHIRQ